MNWLAFGLNGAEIVFNPSATVGELSEPMWPIEVNTSLLCFMLRMCAIVRVFVIVGQVELPKVNMLLITGH